MNLIIKGFIIGIAKIIPGVSGAMIAIIFGIYDNIIEIISNLRKIKKQQMIYLLKIGIGIILSITLTSKIIVKCLEKYYLPTMLLFIGMIIGTTPNLVKKITLKKKDIIISIIILAIFTITINNINFKTQTSLNYTIIDYIKLIGIGMIDAASSIIPGISGTALLMMLGYYNIIIKTFSTTLNIKLISNNIFILSSFIIGFIIGTIILSKIINHIINKNKNIANITITIFTLITIIQILQKTIKYNYTAYELIIGLILMTIGITLSIKLEKN